MTWKVAWGRLAQSGAYRAIRLGVIVFVVCYAQKWVELGTDFDDVDNALQATWDDVGTTIVLSMLAVFGVRVGLDPVNRIPSLREAPIPVEPTRVVNPPQSTSAVPAATGYAPGTGV